MGRTDDMFVAGDMNLFANVIATAVERVAGATGRVTIELDRVDTADRLVLRVEGKDVNEDAVRGALFVAYPEFSTNISNGNIMLDIQIGVSLGPQIKAFKIVDRRSGFGDHRQVIPMEGA